MKVLIWALVGGLLGHLRKGRGCGLSARGGLAFEVCPGVPGSSLFAGFVYLRLSVFEVIQQQGGKVRKHRQADRDRRLSQPLETSSCLGVCLYRQFSGKRRDNCSAKRARADGALTACQASSQDSKTTLLC